MSKRRRPEQQSMLTLMGSPELEPGHPFKGFRIADMKIDNSTGAVLEVTTTGPDCPEQVADEDPWWEQPAPEDDGHA